MEKASYNIIFRGEIAEGRDIEEVKKNLASLFKVSDEKIEQLFSKRAVNIKKNVEHATAIKYKEAIEKAGALCSVVPFSGETDQKTLQEADKQQQNAHNPDVVESEPTETSPLSIPHTLNVITPERTFRDLRFSPVECPSISRAGNCLNFSRIDIQNVSFDTIVLASVFAEEVSSVMEYRIVLFLKNFKRPYITNVDKIRYQDFPNVKHETSLGSLRNFILFLCNKNPDIITDKHTHEFLNGNEQNLLKVEPLDFITSLGKALEK